MFGNGVFQAQSFAPCDRSLNADACSPRSGCKCAEERRRVGQGCTPPVLECTWRAGNDWFALPSLVRLASVAGTTSLIDENVARCPRSTRPIVGDRKIRQ